MPVVVVVTGESSPVVLVDVRGSQIAIAFGSAVHRSSHTDFADFLHGLATSAGDVETNQDLDFVGFVVDLDRALIKIATGTGHHRLFIDTASDGLVVSSHLKVVADAKASSLSINRNYEDFMLGFGFTPFQETVYSGINESQSGTIVDYVQDQVVKLSFRKIEVQYTPGDSAAKMLRVLEEALDRQVAGARAHAVLMGGFDSALVAALLRRRGEPVTTFTFDFGSEKFNQPHVDLVTKTLGNKHIWVPITPDGIGEHLCSLPSFINSPAAKPHYQLHTIIASKLVAEHGFSHVFTGDGCDAAFLSFPTVNKRASLYEAMSKLPRPLLAGLLNVLSSRTVDRGLGHIARLARSVIRAQLLPWPANAHLPSCYLDDVTLDQLRGNDGSVDVTKIEDVRIKLAKGLGDAARVEVAFNGNAITGASRAKVDGSVLSSGVAQSSPFTDHHVKSFLASIPLRELRPDGYKESAMPKSFLSQMTLSENLLPEVVVTQAKRSPATSPIDSWYAGPLRSTIDTLLVSLPFDCDAKTVCRLLTPNALEAVYREKVTLGLSIMEPIALLASYAAFCKLEKEKAK